jgi:hypothetical protein
LPSLRTRCCHLLQVLQVLQVLRLLQQLRRVLYIGGGVRGGGGAGGEGEEDEGCDERFHCRIRCCHAWRCRRLRRMRDEDLPTRKVLSLLALLV